MHSVIIDVQGFNGDDGNFVAKELAIADGSSGRTEHYIFKPPHHYSQLSDKIKKQVQWLRRFYHGLAWDSGDTCLDRVNAILKRTTAKYDVVYCKGRVKAEFLKQFLDPRHINVIDLGEDSDLSLKTCKNLRTSCFSHELNYCACALTNVRVIYYYLNK